MIGRMPGPHPALRPGPVPAPHAPDPDAAWRALVARDARQDGRFFVGVTSTGVYCRPICRVRTPRRENCRFFASAAQAEAARFRPCLKCRPELAPGPGPAWSVMDASRTLARQAAAELDRLACAPAGEAPALSALAARLGISDRHLRRIFVAEHGVTPLQHLQTRRLLQAKHLLTDSALPVTEVALASGFRSLRRFNAAFAEHYRLSPLALRRSAPGAATAAGVAPGTGPGSGPGSLPRAAPLAAPAVELRLDYRPPFDVEGLLAFFAQRAVPGVEAVELGPRRLRRGLRAGAIDGVDHGAGWLELVFEPARPAVRLRLAPALAAHSAALAGAVRRWLDLDADPQAIGEALACLAPTAAPVSCDLDAAAAAGTDGTNAGFDAGADPADALPAGWPSAPAASGLRLPGALDGFEIAVRAVLGQRVTVAAARTLAARLVERFGSPLKAPWPELRRAFPTPAALAQAEPSALGTLGLLRRQVAAIQALARLEPRLAALARGSTAPQAAAEALLAALDDVPGLGPWTAHYLAMRRLGWADAFPPGDVAVLNALGLGRRAADLREAARRVEPCRPWRAYAVLRLWQVPPRSAAGPTALPPASTAAQASAPAQPGAGPAASRSTT